MTAPALSVLARPAFKNRLTNPYNFLLYSALRERGVRIDEYALHRAFGRYDVVHVHWPESTFNETRLEAWLTTRALLSAIDASKTQGAKLLWTLHNLNAHERKFPALEAGFMREFLARVDAFIALGPRSVELGRERYPELGGRPAFVVPHHHYGSEYACVLDRQTARRRLDLPSDAKVLSFVGRVAPYKGVLELIAALASSRDQSLRLLIAGRATTRDTGRAVTDAAGADSRVRLRLGFVERAALGLYLAASDLVVLPYRDVLNSGSAMLALSAGRPVLLPRTGAFDDLAQAMGPDWVMGFDALDGEVLADAAERAVSLRGRTNRDRLAPLAPARVAEQTLGVYSALRGFT